MVWADAWWRGQLEELRRKAAKEAASQYGAAFGASFAATYASIRDKARARLAEKVPLPTPRPLRCVRLSHEKYLWSRFAKVNSRTNPSTYPLLLLI